MEEKEISVPESGKVAETVENNVTQLMGLLYGMGMMMFSGWNQMLTSYWNFFMTEAVGLDPATMGTITSVASVGAWFFVFIAAIIVERVWFRWGQYRSYILIAPPLAFLFTLGAWTDWTWAGVETGSALQIGLLGTLYTIGQFCVSLFMISATGLIPAVSKTEADRALLSARKAQCQLVIKLFFAAVSLPMIIFFCGGDITSNAKPTEPIGYTITSFIWGIFFVAAFVGLFILFKGKDPTEEFCEAKYQAKKRGEKLEREVEVIEKVSVLNCIKYFVTNPPALGLLIGEIGRAIYTMVLQSLAVYYCTLVFDDPRLYAGLMTVGNATGLVGTFVGEFLGTKVLGSRWTYIVACLIVTISLVIGYFIGSTSVLVFTVIVCATFFGANMMMSVEYSCMSNGIAWQEWKQGETAKAFIMGTIQWCPNIGKIFQGFMVGWGLAAVGYTSNAEVTPELVQGITMITFLLPAAVMGICTLAFVLMHRLTTDQVHQINADLDARHNAKKAEAEEAAEEEVVA